MKRSPMKRGTTALHRSAMKGSRKRVNPVSDRRVASNARRRPLAAVVLENECLVKLIGAFAVPPCFGGPSVHEPWTQGRGGPRDDARNMVSACIGHNEWLSQTVEGQRWGGANGLLISAAAGPAWLEAGGVLNV